MRRLSIGFTTGWRRHPGLELAGRVLLYSLILAGALLLYTIGTEPNVDFVYTNF